MRKIFAVVLAFSLFLFPIMAESQSSTNVFTLADCYKLALKRSESIAIHVEQIKEAEARFAQALSGVLPKLHYSYSERRQDGNNSGNFTLDKIPEQKFTVSQPLFSGFKEFAAMAASRSESRQLKFEKSRAEQLLFMDVVNAFYLYASYQQEHKVMGSIRDALSERIVELRKREDLGRSRPSEVASVESRLGRVEADMEFIAGEREVTRQLLEFLTGTAIDVVVDDPNLPELNIAQTDIEKKVEQRDDVLAAEAAWQKAKKEVVVAQAGFWPTVSLDGNYYTKRVGNSKDVDWDVTLSADMPIFTGGENVGKFKEARAVSRQEELTYQETKRKVVLDIRNALTSWESSRRRLEAVRKALAAAERNYTLQQEDYKLNLVNNLDVLQALEDTEDMRRDFINIQSESKRDYWQLKVSVGEISEMTQ